MRPKPGHMRVARAARMHHESKAAARALGLTPTAFVRLCREYGIETPYGRRCRERQEAKARRGQADQAQGRLFK